METHRVTVDQFRAGTILAQGAFFDLCSSIDAARGEGLPVIVLMGGHVPKVGGGYWINKLIDAGIITHVAMNGSALIHDLDIGLYGSTSEDIWSKDYGVNSVSRFTAGFIERALTSIEPRYGVCVSEALRTVKTKIIMSRKTLDASDTPRDKDYCILDHTSPTVHISIGTDFNHIHEPFDVARHAEASFYDFQDLSSAVQRLVDGGVVVNLGSAVVMPEVFMKARLLAQKNMGGRRIEDYVAANLDMIQHYRAGRLHEDTIRITGHHELTLPALCKEILG
jgi:hypothetical protein